MYRVLGLEKGASAEDIKKAYRWDLKGKESEKINKSFSVKGLKVKNPSKALEIIFG